MAAAYRAIHRNARISPRKARLVAHMISPRFVRAKGGRRERRPMDVAEAQRILEFSDKRAAVLMLKVLKSAEANAGQQEGVDTARLVVSRVQVNEGPRLKRVYPRPRGVATPIARPMCHIEVELSETALVGGLPEAPPAASSPGTVPEPETT